MAKATFFSRPAAILLSLLIILVSCLIASGVQTDNGNIKISDVRFVGDYGNQISGLLYQPAKFDPKKKLPAVLTAHGYINTREVQDAFDIEFARRGYVVLSVDMEGHGYSEQVPYDPTQRGTLSALSYLRNLGFVDNTKIALEGHSMGGWSVLAAAGAKPEWVNTVIQEGSSPETFGTPKVLADTPFNYGIVYSKYDEFAPLMWGIPKASQIVNTDKLKNAFGTKDTVIPNKLYGSYDNKSARMLYQPSVIHPGDHWSKAAVGDAIEFLQNAMPAPKPDDAKNQTWRMKEYGTFIALIGVLMLMISAAGNLLRTNYFRPIAEPLPQSKAIRTKGSWWIGALIATAIPAVSFFQFQTWGSKWFAAGSFWPQSLTNGFVVWVILNSLIAVILLAVWHFLSNKKEGGSLHHYGVSFAANGYQIDLPAIRKSVVLAISTVGVGYLLTLIIDSVFHLDFRIWVISLKVMTWPQVVIMLKYLAPFLLYFLVNSVVLHGQFRLKESTTEAKTAWKWFFANASINTVGILVLILIQYIPLFVSEELFWPTQSLLGIVAFQFVPVNIVVSLISTYFFRKTGKIYTGAFANALLITWYIVAGQAVQYAGQPVSNGWAIVFVIISVILVLAGLLLKRNQTLNKVQTINS